MNTMPFCSALLEGLRLELVLVDELRGFLLGQQLERLADLDLACLRPVAAEVREHSLQLLREFLHAGRRHDLDADRDGAQFDLDVAVVELSFAKHLAEPLPGVALASGLGLRAGSNRARTGQQRIEHALFGGVHRARLHLFHLAFAGHLDRDVHEILDDRVHLAPDVADLGELRRLDLDERRVREPREPAGDLGLADAGRPDHQDVLGRDLGAQPLLDLHAPPAVAQRDGDGALGRALADDVLVEFLDDLAGGHGGHGRSGERLVIGGRGSG